MQFGLFIMPCHNPADNLTLALTRDIEMIQYAEELGFDEVWIGEHHSGGWETIPAPDVFISAAARETKRIRLGAGVVNLPYHHPFHVAERYAFLDHLTYGRAMLGMGPGALATDIKLFGLDREALRPMMRESLEIILKLYREDGPVTYEGSYWTIKNMRLQLKPYQEPYLPLAVASTGGFSRELAAKHGLSLLSGNFFGGVDATAMGEHWRQVEEIGAVSGHRMDRDRDWRVATYVYLADSNEEAVRDIENGVDTQIKDYFFNLGIRAPFQDREDQPDGEIGFDQILRKGSSGFGWIVGDPDHCIRRLREAQRDTGGFGTLLIIAGEWTAKKQWDHCLELFARYVMPQFKTSLHGPMAAHRQMASDNASGALRR